MTTKTQLFLLTWMEARTRFSNQLGSIQEGELKKKLSDSPNSAGFLIRHIADVELLFGKNVFGSNNIKVTAKTVIDKADLGEWTHLQELTDYVQYAFDSLKEAIESQTDEDWEASIVTKEFGTRTKSEALGRIISHTAYHAGQLAIILKYGSV